jgi:hypothetical protein
MLPRPIGSSVRTSSCSSFSLSIYLSF